MNTGKTYKTRQRAEIVRIMRSSGDCLTVREICERLSASGANDGLPHAGKDGVGGRRAPL